jgi:hypothetical protein
MLQDCKDRVGEALHSGRDPVESGQIYPSTNAALGSYYLFYSGVKQSLPDFKSLDEILPSPTVKPRTLVQDIPGQGKGVLAARSFQAGELIAAERPLLVLPAVDMSLALGSGSRTVNMRNWGLSSLVRNSMKRADQEAVAALHNAHSTDARDYAGIFSTNALTIPSLPGHNAPYGALCAHLARINHSYVFFLSFTHRWLL